MITKIQSYSSAYNAYSANKAMNKNSVKNSATSFSGKKFPYAGDELTNSVKRLKGYLNNAVSRTIDEKGFIKRDSLPVPYTNAPLINSLEQCNGLNIVNSLNPHSTVLVKDLRNGKRIYVEEQKNLPVLRIQQSKNNGENKMEVYVAHKDFTNKAGNEEIKAGTIIAYSDNGLPSNNDVKNAEYVAKNKHIITRIQKELKDSIDELLNTPIYHF